MNSISIYAARHADEAHIREFFSKGLLREGEKPIALFDGVFYEAKNERVGGLSFHDYLIFSNRSVYIWARGISKDVLDRFSLAAVSFSVKERDEEFVTLDLAITREGKPSVYLIFDLVPKAEASQLELFHVLSEATMDTRLGKNFTGELPDEVADEIYLSAQQSLPPREFLIYTATSTPVTSIGAQPDAAPRATNGYTQIYGQSTLQQLKDLRASINNGTAASGQQKYSADFLQGEPRPMSPLPLPQLDMVTLKRVEAMAKDVFSAIPPELRETALRDFQKYTTPAVIMPQTISALGELLTNITQNEQTQDFVLAAIATAVKNDGLVKTMTKAVSMLRSEVEPPQSHQASNGAHASQSAESETAQSSGNETESGKDSHAIHIRFDDGGEAVSSTSKANEPIVPNFFNAESGTPQRKKIKIKAS